MNDFIRDLFSPSQGLPEGPQGRIYGRAVIAMAHAVLGSVAALVASMAGMWLLYVLIVGYLGKEVMDVRRGGSCRDSAEDTMCVLVGAIGYAAAPMMLPVVLLAVGAVVGVVAS